MTKKRVTRRTGSLQDELGKVVAHVVDRQQLHLGRVLDRDRFLKAAKSAWFKAGNTAWDTRMEGFCGGFWAGALTRLEYEIRSIMQANGLPRMPAQPARNQKKRRVS